MNDPEWMVENLSDDLALQMGLYLRGEIRDIDVTRLRSLSELLGKPLLIIDGRPDRSSVEELLDAYSFAATKQILRQARELTEARKKKLLVVLLDPKPLPYRESKQKIIDFKDYHQGF